MTNINEAVRQALLELLGSSDEAPSFYRKGDSPKGSQQKATVIFVGTEDEKRTPLYLLSDDEKAVQTPLNMGSGNPEDDVYTVTGKLLSIETRVKPAYKGNPAKTSVRTIIQGSGNSRLILQGGLGTVFTSKLLLLMAAATTSGRISIGSTIGIRVERGTKEAKVIFPSLGYETASGWTGINIKDTPWDSDEYFGKNESERDRIALELLPVIGAALNGETTEEYHYQG
jgi:hypothetical protein